MQNSVTIKDVATRAGVAVSTVSRVINNMDRVSPKTREKVLRAIDELGFARNNFAASIKTGATKFIVTIVPDIINEFYPAVIRGVEKVARQKGYYTLVYTTGEPVEQSMNGFYEELSRMGDGIIVVPPIEGSVDYQSADKPVVIIDRELPNNNGSSITIDNYKGACELTQELIDNGHKKIAFIIGKSSFNVTVDRIKGFRDTLAKNGIEMVDEYMCVGHWYEEDGYRFSEKLMSLPEPPTAIFAGNNQICYGCAKYMMDHNKEIGKDISIVGFDDFATAAYLGGGITTTASATFEMGCMGAEMLIALLEGSSDFTSEKKVVLDVELSKRHSVARLG